MQTGTTTHSIHPHYCTCISVVPGTSLSYGRLLRTVWRFSLLVWLTVSGGGTGSAEAQEGDAHQSQVGAAF